jgi:anti-sigma B factor antagonist
VDDGRRLHLRPGAADGELALSGELDVATTSSLDTRLRAADAGETVTLDLSGITFIDSSGLRVLIEHHQRFESAGGRLQLVKVSSRASRLLEMAGLSEHLHVT